MIETASLLLDAVIILLLLVTVVQGVRRGFILTLCSLLAIFLALAGGWYLATHYVQPVQEKLEPMILERLLPEEKDIRGEQQEAISPVQAQMEDAIREAQIKIITEQAEAMAAILARAILFLGGFVGVLLVWIILCHALDLVARLPGLHFINKALGGCLGLVKGILIFLLLRWLLYDVLHLIPAEVAAGSYVFSYLSSLQVLPMLTSFWLSW